MNINRRNFLGKSLFLGTASAVIYSIGKANSASTKLETPAKVKFTANYQNTAHNRQYYQNARF